MNCASCNLQKISLQLMAYEGFLCTSGHIQCSDCNVRYNKYCGVCGNTNECALIVPQSHLGHMASRQVPPAEGNNYLASSTAVNNKPPSCCVATLPLLAEVAKLSMMLQETLKRHDFKTADEYNQGNTSPETFRRSSQNNVEKSALMGGVSIRAMSECSTSDKNATRETMQNVKPFSSNNMLCPILNRNHDNNLLIPKNFNDRNVVQAKSRCKFRASELVLRKTGAFKEQSLKHYQRMYEPLAIYNFQCYKYRRANCKSNKNTGPADPPQMRSASLSSGNSTPCLRSARSDTTYAIIGNQLPQIEQNVNDRHINTTKLAANIQTSVSTNTFPGQQIQNARPSLPNVANANRFAPNFLGSRKTLSKFLPTACAQIFQLNKTISTSSLFQDRMSLKPDSRQYSILDAFKLKPPSPFKCPDSQCFSMLCMSDFEWHFDLSHSQLAKDCITLHQCKNFLLNRGVEFRGNSNCHHLFYLMDQLTGQNLKPYKYFLPLVVMSSIVSVPKPCGQTHAECLVLWITGMALRQRPIYVTFSVLPQTGAKPPRHLIYSGEIHNILNTQKTMDVLESGRMLMLSMRDVSILTNKFKDRLNMQLIAEIREGSKDDISPNFC